MWCFCSSKISEPNWRRPTAFAIPSPCPWWCRACIITSPVRRKIRTTTARRSMVVLNIVALFFALHIVVTQSTQVSRWVFRLFSLTVRVCLSFHAQSQLLLRARFVYGYVYFFHNNVLQSAYPYSFRASERDLERSYYHHYHNALQIWPACGVEATILLIEANKTENW